MLDTIRKSILMLPADRRWRWLALPVLAALMGVAEGGAAAAVFALIKVIADPAAVASVPIAGRIAPLLPWQDPRGVVVAFTVLVALYHVAKNVLVVGTQYVRHHIIGESSAALACTMLRGYLLASYPFHFRRHSAELIRSTTHSVAAVLTTLGAAGALLSELLVGAGIAAVLLIASPVATLVAGVVLAGLIGVLLRGTRQLARRTGRGGHEIQRDLLQTLQNAFGAIKEIKALGREGFFYRTYAEKQRELLALGYLGVTLGAIPPVVVETVFVCGALLVVALLTLTGQGGGGLPLLGLFAYAGFRIIPMANRLTWRVNEIRAGAPAVNDLYDDHRLVTGAGWGDTVDDAPPLELCDTIVLEGVSYTYPGSDTPALQDVNLTIRHGESIGFVGATGAGKSTLADIVMGLLPPSAGRWTGSRSTPRAGARGGATSATCRSRSSCSTTRSLATSRSGSPTGTSIPSASAAPSMSRSSTHWSTRSPRASTRASASAARDSRGASASASASRALSTTSPTCSCSTRRPRRSTPSPRPRCSRPCAPCTVGRRCS